MGRRASSGDAEPTKAGQKWPRRPETPKAMRGKPLPPLPDSGIPAAGRFLLDAFHAENRASAARLRACHKLFEVCEDEQFERMLAAGYDPELDDSRDYALVDPCDIACAEIVAAYGVHVQRARAILRLAHDLVLRFPAIIEAMESGRLDESTAEMLAKQMRTVDAGARPTVQKAVVDWLLDAMASGKRPGRSAILSMTDTIIAEHDPEGVLYRRREALTKRHVSLRRSSDGMSTLHANLASTEAEAVYSALQSAAREMRRDEKAALSESAEQQGAGNVDFSAGRTMDQLRADALVEAFICPGTSAAHATSSGGRPGEDTAPGTAADAQPDPSPGGRLAAQLRPHITVLTSLGPNGEPEVYLPRGGVASIEALIALLTRSVGATISTPDPEPGAADSPQAAHRYRISAELARQIRLRDGTCRHPGCSVPADDCDIDHVRPFSHINPDIGGLTVEANLMCLCRRHHRFKTFHGWRYRLARDGTLTVTTDTGHTLTTDPAGPLARWRRSSAALEPPDDPDQPAQTDGANPRPHNPSPQPTHWLQRTRRLLAERRLNSAARHAPEPGSDPPPF